MNMDDIDAISAQARKVFTQVPQAHDLLQGFATLPERLAALIGEQCQGESPEGHGSFAMESLGLRPPAMSLSECVAQGKPYVTAWAVRFVLRDSSGAILHSAITESFCTLPLMVGTPQICTADPALYMANGGGGFFVCAKGIQRTLLPQRTLVPSLAHVRENGNAQDLVLEFRAAAGERSSATTFLYGKKTATSDVGLAIEGCATPEVVPTSWLKFQGKQYTIPAQWLLALLGFRGKSALQKLLWLAGVTKLPQSGDKQSAKSLAERQAKWALWCNAFAESLAQDIEQQIAEPASGNDVWRACVRAFAGFSAGSSEPILAEAISRLRYLMGSEFFPHVAHAFDSGEDPLQKNHTKAILLVQCCAHLGAICLGLRPIDNRDHAAFCGYVELPHAMLLFYVRSLLTQYVRGRNGKGFNVRGLIFDVLAKLASDELKRQDKACNGALSRDILAMLTQTVFKGAADFSGKIMSAMGKRLRPGTRGTGRGAEKAANSGVTQAILPRKGGSFARGEPGKRVSIAGANRRLGRGPRQYHPSFVNLICAWTTGTGLMTGLTPQSATGLHYALGSPLHVRKLVRDVWDILCTAKDVAFTLLARAICARQAQVSWVLFSDPKSLDDVFAANLVNLATDLVTSIVVNGIPIGAIIAHNGPQNGNVWPQAGSSGSIPMLALQALRSARSEGLLPRDASIFVQFQDHVSVHVRHQEGTMMYWVFDGPRQCFRERWEALPPNFNNSNWNAWIDAGLVRSMSVHEAAALRISLTGLREMMEEPTMSASVVAPDLATCARIFATPLSACKEPYARAAFLRGMLSQTLAVNPLPLSGGVQSAASAMLNERALVYPQRNIVESMDEPFPEATMGQTAQIVSVAVMTDNVMQDGIMVSKAFLERGGFAYEVSLRESVAHGTDCGAKEKGHFQVPWKLHDKVPAGAPLIVWCNSVTGEQRIVRTQNHWCGATLQWVNEAQTDVLLVALELGGSHWLGQKLTNDAGQKGVVSVVYDAEDGPFCPITGMQFDVIVSSFGMTRQVASALVSLFVSHLSAAQGRTVKLPNFASTAQKEAETCDLLRQMGFGSDGDGRRMLINGKTGQYYGCKIFTGLQQQTLLYHPYDSSRNQGPWASRSILTRAPLTAPRMGAQEERVLANHGAAGILRERLQAGAGIAMWTCTNCGDDIQQQTHDSRRKGRRHACKRPECIAANASAVQQVRMHPTNMLSELWRMQGLDVRITTPMEPLS